MAMHPLIVGGQGTYQNGCFYTEYPDRELCLEYIREIGNFAEKWGYTHIICSGGYTQKQTPDLSEAQSIRRFMEESGTIPSSGIKIEEDRIALDSSENIIFSLMELRINEPHKTIQRIGFYSLWQFKKARMNGLAKQLDIQERFYFSAYTDATKANAGDLAKKGEEAQLAEMIATDDFVLRKEPWEKMKQKKKGWDEKRRDRFVGTDYSTRDVGLRAQYPKTFEALDGLRKDVISEILGLSMRADTAVEVAIETLRKNKLKALQRAFLHEVLTPRP